MQRGVQVWHRVEFKREYGMMSVDLQNHLHFVIILIHFEYFYRLLHLKEYC